MERRQFERFPINNFVTYKYSRFSTGVECLTNNISLKGACLISENKLKPQKNIKLKIFFGAKVGAKVVNSRVIYSKPVDDKFGSGYINGVEFSEVIFKEGRELTDNEH